MTQSAIVSLFESKNLRVTPQRVAVYDYLIHHPMHPTADTIYEAVLKKYPSFSKTTVYNSLSALVAAELVRSINIEAKEQRFDATAADHGHFRCSECGEIFDFHIDDTLGASLAPDGYAPSTTDVYINGLCPDCKK